MLSSLLALFSMVRVFITTYQLRPISLIRRSFMNSIALWTTTQTRELLFSFLTEVDCGCITTEKGIISLFARYMISRTVSTAWATKKTITKIIYAKLLSRLTQEVDLPLPRRNLSMETVFTFASIASANLL